MTESETCEFKKSLAELKEGLVSIAAILNKHGAGEVWFGVRNDGQPLGLDVNEKTLRDVSQTIAAHIEPKIYPQVKATTLQGVNCIHIAFSGSEVPYFAHGRAYMRVADEDRQMSARELEKLILAKNRDAWRFDSQPVTAKLSDLSLARVKRFLARAGLKLAKGGDAMENALDKLGVMKDGVLLQAAALFFLKRPPMHLRCAVFAGRTSATIVDQHDFEGDPLELIEEAQKYILKNIRIGMRLNGLFREDVPELPMDALRETIINAFCHRDWADPESVRVAVYADRVEIRSPGSLPEGVTVERLRQGHISRRRNPLVAELMRRVHLVEGWGRGMPLILEKAPQVEFEDVAGIFITRFPRPEKEAAAGSVNGSQESSQESSQETSARVLALMTRDSRITAKRISAVIGISMRAVQKQIASLQHQGHLRRNGSTKSGRWEVLP